MPVVAILLNLRLASRSEDLAEDRDHPLAPFALALLDLGQQFTPWPVDGRHALAEHLRQVVSGPHPRLVQQAGDQDDPLDLANVPQLAGVQHPGLSSEVAYLRRGHSGQPGVRRAQRIQPGHQLQVLAEPGQRGRRRRLLQQIEAAALGDQVTLKQTQQPGSIGRAHAAVDELEEGPH
jgi:hypothetical protein